MILRQGIAIISLGRAGEVRWSATNVDSLFIKWFELALLNQTDKSLEE